MTPHDYLLDHVARILEADEWFAEHRVHIIKQNSADVVALIENAEAEADGVALVVAYDREARISSRPPELEVDFSLLATEYPSRNRCGGDFATALDAVHRARLALGAADASLVYRDTVHATPGEGMLVATARFNTRLIETNEREK